MLCSRFVEGEPFMFSVSLASWPKLADHDQDHALTVVQESSHMSKDESHPCQLLSIFSQFMAICYVCSDSGIERLDFIAFVW